MTAADLANRLAFAPSRADRLARRHGAQRLARRCAATRTRVLVEARVEDIAETVGQPWPRCGGDRIDGADVWLFAGFADDDVIAWLEAGVPKASAAVRLDRAGLAPRNVSRQYEVDVTLGLAFCRGDIDLETVCRLRRR